MPMPERLQVHNLLTRLGADNVLTKEFLAEIDLGGPAEVARNAYARSTAGSLINKMLGYDLQCTLADSDLPKVIRSCELAGVAVNFPMLDDRVVSFSSTLAPGLKLKGTRLRYFFKEALKDFLPREIIRKTKHGFGLPFGPWVVTHTQQRDLVIDSLGGLR
jgi:asparagine synthase (glutamine-hydrolysing)